MCLADKAATRPAEVRIERADRSWIMPGSSAFAKALQDASARYVLQQDVCDACRNVRGEWADLLTPDNPRLRAPLTLFWIEWGEAGSGQEVGILVEAEDDGRSGSLRLFWTSAAGVEVAQGEVLFDLDRTLDMHPRDGGRRFPFTGLPQELAFLQPHLALAFDEYWENYFRASPLGPIALPQAAAECCVNLWPDVVQALAFFALLGARVPLAEKPVDRGRLNKARVKAGKPALLDHVQLTIGRPQPAHSAEHSWQEGARRHPRLHSVRGHLVRRRDQIFWRAPHLRGLENAGRAASPTRIVRMHSD